jgi:predicted  nucleic acid-binding Zn-ribbon protein
VVRAQLRTVCVVLTLLTVGAAPAAGAPAGPEPAGELASTKRELADARDGLSAAETAVRRTNDAVAALDEQLRTASTELAQVRDQLEDARQAAADATAAEREAAASLAAVEDRLASSATEFDEHQARLQHRAVEAYKQGTVLPHDLLVRGVTGAGDWHEVTVALETVSRLVHADRQLADGAVALTREIADLRGMAGDARRQAIDTARAAASEERLVAELAARHERAHEAVSRRREERAAVLESLASNAAARAVLVGQLERQVAALELAALTVLVPVVVDLDVHGPVHGAPGSDPPDWSSRVPPAGRPYAAAIEATAARHGIDARLLAALVWTESNFRPDAVSHAGALGLAQLMPGTARGLGVDPRDPLQNLDGGARYLAAQLAHFGRVDLALAAYNAGPGRVTAAGGVPDIVETQLYVVRVLDRYRAIAGV